MKKVVLCFAILVAMCLQYAVAADFESKDLKLYNNNAGISLGATVTMPPAGVSPKGALVLATGSGAQNRDEEVMGHRPFKVIAEFLSSHGYAVIRLDDRGVGESQGDASQCTADDYIGDLGVALNVLDSIVESDVPKGVLGHSEGGTVAVRMAVRNPECRFIVTMGCPAWPGDSLVMSQARAMAVAMTGRWDGEARQRRLMDIVKSDMPDALVASSLYMELASQTGGGYDIPQVRDHIAQVAQTMSAPSYRSIIKYDPADDIRLVTVPWLALNGEKDMQVLPGNLDTIKELNAGADARIVPGHNHLMQQCGSGMPQEYQSIAEDISDDVLQVILSWLDSVCGGR
ncbi:MAG: alpha/beta fold hydrolase [Muribaculaceae bacterium]|nr:alpha/beta fold hydrolase [Muribaculaceae bacterium]MDE6331152.1 alpha/beta fold hydrolase [Muribaculaceae bacterium]